MWTARKGVKPTFSLSSASLIGRFDRLGEAGELLEPLESAMTVFEGSKLRSA